MKCNESIHDEAARKVCENFQHLDMGIFVHILSGRITYVVSKEILIQYSDLQEEIKEVRQRIEQTERQIERIEQEKTVCDKVRGGEGGLQSFKIEGFPYPEYSRKKTLLYSRKATLTSLEMELLETLNKVEEFITSVSDSRMRRIINLRFVENLSWNKVADRIGGGNTEDSIRMAFNRFMER